MDKEAFQMSKKKKRRKAYNITTKKAVQKPNVFQQRKTLLRIYN